MAQEKYIERIMSFFKRLTSEYDAEENADAEERTIALGDIFWSAYDQSYEFDGYPWLIEVYTNDEGDFFGLFAMDGKVYRGEITIEDNKATLQPAEEWTEISIDPVQQNKKFVIRLASRSCDASL